MRSVAPVILFIFNRPDTTTRVFQAIREARPHHLVICADGPRLDFPDDRKRCEEARRATEGVDWPCEITRIYAPRNLGCTASIERGMRSMLTRFDRAIVLEDDCLPDASFFPYCTELLERFALRSEVLSIAGSRPLKAMSLDDSYAFSRYPLIWGWATWRRAWQHYDGTMAAWPEVRARGGLHHTLADARAEEYWSFIFDRHWRQPEVRSWDYCWMLSAWLSGGLSIVPDRNLVSNIGFGIDGLNCTDPTMAGANRAVSAMPFPLRHPANIVRDVALDASIEAEQFSGTLTRLFGEVRRRIGEAAER
ncbi:MAG: hypothetical protein U0Q11_15385 [Vicinamibacterales bacterium]